MKQSTDLAYDAQGYWKEFYRRALRSLPHHLLLSFSTSLHLVPLTLLLDTQKKHQLHRRLRLREYSDSEVAEYLTYYYKVGLWHGTGRYQHGKLMTIDVLDSMAKQGGLMPVDDVYTVLLTGKPTISVSMTPYRIIARSYADIHGLGIAETNRYGSCLFWAAYFYSKYYLEQNLLHRATVKRNWDAWKTAASQDGKIVWGQKVHSEAEYVWDVFTAGSDIKRNYPIIFAVKPGLRQTKLPHTMAKFENRVTEKITWAQIIYLEVPEDRIVESRQLLVSHGIQVPIFPIELGELVASQQRFSRLLGR